MGSLISIVNILPNICDCCLRRSLSDPNFCHEGDTWTNFPPLKNVSWNKYVSIKTFHDRSTSMDDLLHYARKND